MVRTLSVRTQREGMSVDVLKVMEDLVRTVSVSFNIKTTDK